MMEAVGLVPSAPGEAGGTRPGQKVSHSLQPGGPLDRACRALLAQGCTIPWVALTSGDEEGRQKKAASKTKYVCPSCALNVGGKPDIQVICGACLDGMEATTPEDEAGGSPSGGNGSPIRRSTSALRRACHCGRGSPSPWRRLPRCVCTANGNPREAPRDAQPPPARRPPGPAPPAARPQPRRPTPP
jgi:hypothetical protein